MAEKFTDLELFKTEAKPYWDIDFQDSGDFELVKGFETAILVSLFQNARADESEVPSPEFRSGWAGNEFFNIEEGSKLWLLDQARNTIQTKNFGINYIKRGLEWLKTQNFAKDINVLANRTIENITFNISFVRFDNTVLNESFQLWENTDLESLETEAA